LEHGTEVDLGVGALLPDDYVSDVHGRLILYKRIASAANEDELRELQVELIDRFGLLPQPAKNLFEITQLKLRLTPLGVRKLDVGAHGARLIFSEQTPVDPGKLILLLQSNPARYKLDGQYKLRVNTEMPELEGRLKVIDELIAKLGG
jgi:transcription-repair coupling factor (superfamily II helicase)